MVNFYSSVSGSDSSAKSDKYSKNQAVLSGCVGTDAEGAELCALKENKNMRRRIKEEKARKFLKRLKKQNYKSDVFDKYKIVKLLFENEESCQLNICKDVNDDVYIMKILKRNPSSFKEVYIHTYLQSDYVVGIYDVYMNDEYIYVIMEYVLGGDLFEGVDSMELTLNDSLSIVYRISTLLKYVHSNGVIHGDLKMENILIDKLNMYLCDFGFSVFADSPVTPGVFYTNPYTAPEQLRYQTFNYKSDVWSLGIILFTLCFNTYPFGYDNDKEYTPREMYMLIKQRPIGIPSDTPKRIAKLISGMLEISPDNRYSLKKVRQTIMSL